MRSRKPRPPTWEHIAIRGVLPDDPRVIYACGDAVRYEDGRAADQTERGRRSRSHIFDVKPVACAECMVASTGARAEPLDLGAQAARMHLALRNVLALSYRIAKRDPENAAHLRRFCAEAGVVPSIIRGEVSRGR